MVPTKGTEGERISALGTHTLGHERLAHITHTHTLGCTYHTHTHTLGHERLAIVGVMDDPAAKEAAGSDASQHAKLHSLSGNQPLYSHDRLALGLRLGGPGSRG